MSETDSASSGQPDFDRSAPTQVPARRDTLVGGGPVVPVIVADANLDDMPPGAEFARRYSHATLLGEGGMGEVRLCHDQRIGRDVAMKSIKPDLRDDTGLRSRFVREARVQGQLEHPSVVPVYDLGLGPDGQTWFTMKCVRGRTLAEILDALAADSGARARGEPPRPDPELDPEWRARFGRRRLLSAFASLCLAVDFAHSRGVLHRDLKPGNVMLGDYGEVYLLDWGLAKLLADGATEESVTATTSAEGSARTEAGAIFGTPGFMAPEQIRGEPLGPSSDVFALGAILFEILARQPLCSPGPATQMTAETLGGLDARPSLRAPDRDVPPELDVICQRATAADPAARFPSARALHEAVERFLDGDRDLELRRTLSARHAAEAAAAAERSAGLASPTEEHAERKRAMREVSRALALDPRSSDAMRTMVDLMMRPPSALPDEAKAALERDATTQRRIAARSAMFVYLSWLLFIPALVVLGLRSPTQALLSGVLIVSASVASAILWRRGGPHYLLGGLVLLLSSAGIAAASRSFGPFITVPGIAAANTMGFLMLPERRFRAPILVAGLAVLLVPITLEYLHILPSSYVFEGGRMQILPQMHGLPELPTIVFLTASQCAVLVISSLFIIQMRSSLAEAERRLHLFAWHLGQFLPESALDGVRDAPAPSEPGLACSVEHVVGEADRRLREIVASHRERAGRLDK